VREIAWGQEICNEISGLILDRKIIPVFGAGFTKDSGTKANGKVPDVAGLKEHILDVLSIKYKKDDLKAYDDSTLYSLYDNAEYEQARRNYLQGNFIDVILSKEKGDFLKLDFPCCYTLNIDDAIEHNSNYEVILPFAEFNDNYTSNNSCVFKLHGDAKDYLKYISSITSSKNQFIEKRPLVFSRLKYIDSLKRNQKMLSKLGAEISSNNVIFIGCSLSENEIDILSVVDDAIKLSTGQHEIYYLASSNISNVAKDLLANKGISTLITIDDFNLFYCDLIKACTESNFLKQNPLIKFREPQFIELSKDESTLEFLLDSNGIVKNPYDGKIYIPNFFIERDILNDFLIGKNANSINIIFGHRICGKTYFLISLLRKTSNKVRYFFPSGTQISDIQLESLIKIENSLIVFDNNCLSQEQLNRIVSLRQKILTNATTFVIALNITDRLDLRFSIKDNKFRSLELDSHFSYEEEQRINSILTRNTIPTFLFRTKKDTDGGVRRRTKYYNLIDNLAYIARKFIKPIYKNRFEISIKDIGNGETFAALLLLSMNSETDVEIIYRYRLADACMKLIKAYPSILSRVVSETLNRNSSSLRVVANARYILLKTLGCFAEDKKLFRIVLDGYKYLFKQIEYIHIGEKYSDSNTAREMLDYLKFDVINDLFNSDCNNRDLIKYIYREMESDLNFAFQYKHQRVKSVLWKSYENLFELEQAKKIIDVAKHDAEAMLGKTQNKEKLTIAVEHIAFTQALIYGRVCALEKYENKEMLIATLKIYDEAFSYMNNENDVIEILKEQKSFADTRNARRTYEDFKGLLEFALSHKESFELTSEQVFIAENLVDRYSITL
jgi:hypothetical protein